MRTARMFTIALMAAAAAACSEQAQPTASSPVEPPDGLVGSSGSNVVVPILAEPLSIRNAFTDDVAVQVRVKPDGRSTEVINLRDASHIATIRFTVQPGVRFPWHSHPGLVMVAIQQGELVFVYADDCVRRPYPAGTAFVDPGFGNVHYAFNPTGGETVLIATFLGIPPTGPVTNVVPADEATALDAKCNVAAAMAHAH